MNLKSAQTNFAVSFPMHAYYKLLRKSKNLTDSVNGGYNLSRFLRPNNKLVYPPVQRQDDAKFLLSNIRHLEDWFPFVS